jgi:pimeloyl-ACP methyl ester carboxylesterase
LDIADFMSQNQYKNASLLGHSMGAKVAMTLALRQPILIEKLILVDMAPTVNPISSEIVEFFKYFREIERLNLDIKQANEYLSQYVKNDSIRMFLMTNYKRIGDRYGFRVNLTALEQSLPHLGSFEAGNEGNVFQKDSLFIRGSKSNYVPESSIPTIKQLFPKSKVVTLDAGHWVHFEQPKEFINQCVDFLQ